MRAAAALLALANLLAARFAAGATTAQGSHILASGKLAMEGAPPSASAPAAERSAALLSSLVYGERLGAQPATCKRWDAASQSWQLPDPAPEYGAVGGALPRAGLIDRFTYAICYDDTGARSGEEVRAAVQAGGERAQAAAFSLLLGAETSCGTSNPGAAKRAYQHAVAAAAAHPTDFEGAKKWLSDRVAAADAVGIPACAALALVDGGSGQAVQETALHTGG